MSRLLRDYSLSLTLGMLFLVSLVGQVVAQRLAGETWVQVVAAVLENWQSEYLQLLSFVVLTAYLTHKGSHESKDSDERFRADVLGRLETIERRLEQR